MDWTAMILGATGTAAAPAYPLDGESLIPVCWGVRPVYDQTFFWRTRSAARAGRWGYVGKAGVDHVFDLWIESGENADCRMADAATFERMKRSYADCHALMLPTR
jgi:hypothetical protein